MNYLTKSAKRIFVSFILMLFTYGGYAQCYLQISSKFDQVVAIGSDSTLWTWGQRMHDRPYLLDSAKNWKQVSTGENYAVALKNDGTLWAWGTNTNGQLGDGTTTIRFTPVRVTSDSNWIAVSCGAEFTVALKSNGTVWAWGRNESGQMGQGINRTSRSTPVQIGVDSNFIDISAGRDFTLLRKSTNSLWHVGACYSSSYSSQLTQVGTTTDWARISGGSYYNYAIKQNGTLWEFVSTNGRPTGLTQVGSSTNWQKLDNANSFSTDYHALLIKTDGTLWAVGRNNFGQFGTGNLINSTTPVQVGIDTNWNEAIAGQMTSFALKTDGSFWAWGRNNNAQFGNGVNKSRILPINSNGNFRTVNTPTENQNSHVLALKTNGTLWSWGSNNDGQLGIGTRYNNQAFPVEVGSDTNWQSITTGFYFSLAIKNNGTLWGWGRDSRGQLGTGYGLSGVSSPRQIGVDTNWLAIAAGGEFAIGLKKDSTLWSWGYNYSGQLGNGSSSTQLSPIQIGTDSNWIAIATGNDYSAALKADSTMWTWGSNYSGQLGRSGNYKIPQTVDSTQKFIDVQCGGEHTLAIAADSTLWGCGSNSNWQLGIISTSRQYAFINIDSTKKWLAVTAGKIHSLGIMKDSTLWAWGTNSDGQLGDSTTYASSPYGLQFPTMVSSKKWQVINGGHYSSFAIDTSGTLYSMGDANNSSWQLNYPLLARSQITPLLIDSCVMCTPTDTFLSKIICQGNSYLFGGVNLTSSGTYIDTLVNSSGCDSIISLQLTITNIDTSVAVSGLTLSSNEPGANYQWLDCNNSYSIIAGDTLQRFTPSFNGSYAVEITKNGCLDTSACQLINTVGLSENLLSSSVKLFPNPTSKEFQLAFSKNQNAKVTIIDNQGKVIETRLILGKTIEQFSLASAARGIYLVRIENNKETILFKVLKE